MQLINLAVGLLAAGTALASPTSDYLRGLKIREEKFDAPRGKNLVAADKVTVGFFDQKVNHFGKALAGKTFKQQYAINAANFKSNSTKTPLCIFLPGQEGPMAARDVTRGLPHDLAVAHNALLVTLEHRFYGESNPSLDPKDYWLLTLEQGMEDFNVFVNTFKFKTDDGKAIDCSAGWAAFGGSYSGAVSAWLRLKYPKTFWSAHAGSAPVWAKEKFFEYDMVVEAAVPKIGGSQDCVDGLISATGLIDSILKSGNKQKITALKAKMNLTGVVDNRDFAAFVTSLPALSVQYGPQFDTIGNKTVVQALCNGTVIADKKAKPQAKLDELASLVIAYSSQNGYDASYINTHTSAEIPRDSWWWQTCTEFGYFQTARPGPRSLYSTLVDDEYFRWFCKTNFPGKVIDGNTGKPVEHVRPNTDAINKKYLGLGITRAVSNVLFADGLYDPWHALSVYAQKSTVANVIANHFGHHCDEWSSRDAVAGWRNELAKTWDEWIAKRIPKKSRPHY
ncbi:Thymus-specific serine protease [Geranomyces variabilis]|nr:Thymus-specific serine protease [Geranomyces variabilis]